MKNRFPTLNDALEAENLVAHWPLGVNIGYGETVSLASQRKFISVYRDEQGIYERPVQYVTKMADGVIERRLD